MGLIDKSAVVAEIAKRIENCAKQREDMLDVQCYTLADGASARMGELNCIQDFLDTLEVKESDETAAKAFAKIIRANLTGIDKDVQYKFEQLYKEITGEKMYQ